ncbi:DUF2939 domain-containing protein [Acinetobacter sp. MD2(2019)]|uniref:DUF2939 domain-containing protein n=1 Tax=Acinetobacter sp. MD2(2019) TaxID=2605273 RepID=UPI002D1F84C5|nr:DUF2939 domain-containing protein [Acinetobacter sp. MD2(2019)]MEB3753689.1 DUF2939 domain-containing protein [Acinetobacter sp. MD2(2019)]
MKKWLGGVGVVLLIVLGTWVASPYWMLYQLKQAYEQNQSEKISSYIDYAQVRESLQPQIESVFLSHLEEGQDASNSEWYQRIHAILDTHISRQILDLLVSDQTIQLLMQGKQLSELIPQFEKSVERHSAQNMLQANTNIYVEPTVKQDATYHAAYTSPNTFVVSLIRQNGKRTQFIFNRVAGWNWKMTAIDLGLN